MKLLKKWLLVFLTLFLVGCSPASEDHNQTSKEEEIAELPVDDGQDEATDEEVEELIDYDGIYTTKEDVALYLHTYNELPSNFITKKEAQKLGWPGGGLDDYVKNGCIGGDRFGNYEKNIDTDEQLYECDIDTMNKKSRGAKRLVYSQDGDIYYTEDHYNTFVQLYEGD